MILRTPPPRKRRVDESSSSPLIESPISDRRIVVYNNDNAGSLLPDQLEVCTYHCRQMVKSEFMVALSSAEKQAADNQSMVEKLSNQLRKSEEERNEYKDHLQYVQQELEAAKGREHALQEQLMKEVTETQERYQVQLKRGYELEGRLKKELDSRKNAELLAAEAKERIIALEGELQRLSESTAREKNYLKRELLHLQDDSKLSISRLTADLEKTKLGADNSQKESELLKEQLKDLQEQLNECLNQKSEIERKLASSVAPSYETGLSDNQNLVKLLQEELRNYEAEVHEARKLKSSHLSYELLKQKLLEEKSYREKAEMELSKLQEVQCNAQKIESELESWKSLLKEIPDVSCYDDIPRKFSQLQKQAIENMMMAGEIRARLKEFEVALELAELSKEEAEKESALAKEKAEISLLEVKRLEQMLSLVSKEREQLKNDSICNKQKSGLPDSPLEKESFVKDLEKTLAERESAIRELETSLHEQKEVIAHQHNELKMMNEKLIIEARRVKSLEREGDQLRSEISLLESKLGHGDYSAASTKVLRMVNTLAVDNEAKHTIETLRAELQKTQAKLQAVEELKGQSDAGKIMDADIPEKLAKLKGQIAILEKREERYKTVFAEKISVFRRACCSLFGYKIVMDDQQRPNGIPVTRFTLQSIYAQNDDEKLEFDYESGNASILVNEYTSQPEISHQVEIFIRKMNSIPAFTANLTMESFNKRTLS